MELKTILLQLNIVEDNEYLDKYCELIETNKDTKRIKGKTHKHHIITKSYYKINISKVLDKFLKMVYIYVYNKKLKG